MFKSLGVINGVLFHYFVHILEISAAFGQQCWPSFLVGVFPQVYEHVYETVDINSSPEVRANATAKVNPKHLMSSRVYKEKLWVVE